MKDVIKSQQNNDEYKLINGKKVKLNRRRRRSSLNNYYALAIVFAAIIVLILCMTVFFNVKTIGISGTTLYTNDQILAVGGVNTGGNLIRTNTDIIEKRLSENLPYIETVTVKKDYPASIKITITEAKQSAEIEDGGKYCLISKSGKILEINTERSNTDLPLVTGFELKSAEVNSVIESEDSFKADILTELMADLEEAGFESITTIDLTERTNIKLNYDGRIDIILGSSVDMDYKLTSVKAVIDKSLAENYEGTLRCIGTSGEISAIAKEAETVVQTDSSETDSTDSTDTEDLTDSTDSYDTADTADTSYTADTQTDTDTQWDTGEDYWNAQMSE